METNIISIINKLKYFTEKRIKNSMECRNVSKYDMSMVRVYERNDFGHHKEYFTSGTSLFIVRDFPYTFKSKLETYTDTLDNLIAKRKCYPFMIFLNGKFIKWSEITVIKEDKETYLYFSKFDEDRCKRTVVLLPNIPISYSENSNTNSGLFIFDENGYFTKSINPIKKYTSISFSSDDILVETGRIKSGVFGVSKKFTPKEKLNTKNILVFKNGKFDNDDMIKTTGVNTFIIHKQTPVVDCDYFLFYNKKAEDSVDNDTDIKNYEYLRKIIIDGQDIPEYLLKLNEPFNFEYDRKLSYEKNLNNALSYILKYNACLINDAFKEECNIKMKSFTGKYLKSKQDENGFVTMSRMYDNNPENYIMIFCNGNLYDYYYATVYTHKDFKFPVYYLKDEDNIEICYLLNINNKEQPIRFYSAADNDIKELGNIDIQNYRLYSDILQDPIYDNIITGDNMFEIEFEYNKLDDNKYEIYPKDNFYYDKNLSLVDNRRFQYFRTIIQEGYSEVFIDLPSRFKYCYDYTKYMIFLNGKKLDLKSYLITIPKSTRPFDVLSVYFNKELVKGDVVEIFYIGLDIEEVYNNDDLNINGNIVMDRSKLKFGFDKDLYLVFINGRKIPYNNIIDIDSNKLQILSNGSTKNVSIIRLSSGYKTITEMMQLGVDLKTDTFNNISDTGNNLYHGSNMTNTETNIKDGALKPEDILNEIIHDFWRDWYDKSLGDFLFDFDQANHIIEPNEDGEFYIDLFNRQN